MDTNLIEVSANYVLSELTHSDQCQKNKRWPGDARSHPANYREATIGQATI
jgi:hypothetical protein